MEQAVSLAVAVVGWWNMWCQAYGSCTRNQIADYWDYDQDQRNAGKTGLHVISYAHLQTNKTPQICFVVSFCVCCDFDASGTGLQTKLHLV